MIRQILLASVVFVALLAVSRAVLAENPAPASQPADAWRAVLGEEDSYRKVPAKEEVQIGDLKAMFTRSRAGKSRPYGPDEAWFCPVPNKTGRGVFLVEGTAAKIPDEFFWIPIQIKCKTTRDGRLLIGWVQRIPYPSAPDDRPGWRAIAKGTGIAYYIDPAPQVLFKGTLLVLPTRGKGDLRPSVDCFLQVTAQRRIALTGNDAELPAFEDRQIECGAKPADNLPADQTKRITVGWVRLVDAVHPDHGRAASPPATTPPATQQNSATVVTGERAIRSVDGAAAATQPSQQDLERTARAEVVLRVKVEKAAEPFLAAHNKVTFKVLDVYKGTDKKTGMGSLEKGGEFWLIYLRRTGPIEAGEMTVYLRLKTETMRAGMGPVRTAYTPELLQNSAADGVSHIVRSGAATQPSAERANEAWGEPSGGLQAGLRMQKTAFGPQEPIEVELLVKNTTDHGITMQTGGDDRTWSVLFGPYERRLRAPEPIGQTPLVLDAGQTKTFSLSAGNQRFRFAALRDVSLGVKDHLPVGEYQVSAAHSHRYRRDLPGMPPLPEGTWQGTLTTGTLHIQVYAAGPVSQPAGDAPAAAVTSRPVVVDGLAVQVSPAKAQFLSPGEPLTFTVTLKNVSDKPFSVNAAALVTDEWRFYDVTATSNAGVTFASPWPDAPAPAQPLRGPFRPPVKASIPLPDPRPKMTTLAPGASLDVTIVISANAFWRKRSGNLDLGEGQCLGLGKYSATFTVRPGAMPGQTKGLDDPIPWAGQEIVCNPLTFEVVQKQPPDPPGPLLPL